MKLLVAVDTSEHCRETLGLLQASGISMGAQVRFVHVSRSGQNSKDVSSRLAPVNSLLTNASSVETIILEGNPAERIVEYAAQWQADLIALGTSDKRGIERLLLGSVSKTVLAHASCPVLILRGEDSKFSNVLVAADNSESSAGCMEWLSGQAWAKHKNLAILSVMDEQPASLTSEFGAVEWASEALHRKHQEELKVAHLSQSWSELCASILERPEIPFVVTDGKAVQAILELSKQWKTDLIVLGSNCKSGLEKLLHGSVSESVADKAECSVLVVRDVPATLFEEVRNFVAASAEARRLETEKALSARAFTSLAVNDFSAHFPANM